MGFESLQGRVEILISFFGMTLAQFDFAEQGADASRDFAVAGLLDLQGFEE